MIAINLVQRANHLNLNSGVVNPHFPANQRGLLQDIVPIAMNQNMSSHCRLSVGQVPNVEIVDFLHIFDTFQVLFKLDNVQFFGGLFHQNMDDADSDGEGKRQGDNRKAHRD